MGLITSEQWSSSSAQISASSRHKGAGSLERQQGSPISKLEGHCDRVIGRSTHPGMLTFFGGIAQRILPYPHVGPIILD
jgi:hypothetical protein